MKNSLLLLLGLLLSAVFAGSHDPRTGQTVCWPKCFSEVASKVDTPEDAARKFLVLNHLNGIVGTRIFNKYVDVYSDYHGSLWTTDKDTDNVGKLSKNWVDSFEKMPVDDMNEWLKNFATGEQRGAVMFCKRVIEGQYEHYSQLVKSEPGCSFSSGMQKVWRIRKEKLNGLSMGYLNF